MSDGNPAAPDWHCLPKQISNDAARHDEHLPELVQIDAIVPRGDLEQRLVMLGDPSNRARMVRTGTAAVQQLPPWVLKGMREVKAAFKGGQFSADGELGIALTGGAVVSQLTQQQPPNLNTGELDLDMVVYCTPKAQEANFKDHVAVMSRIVEAFARGTGLNTSQALVWRQGEAGRPPVVTLAIPRPGYYAEEAAERVLQLAASGAELDREAAERARKAEEDALEEEKGWWKERQYDDNTLRCVTVQFLPYLKVDSTAEEVGLSRALCGFDLDACRCAITAEGRVVGTPAFLHALSTGVLIVEGERVHRTYALRVAKYCKLKGFAVALPVRADAGELFFRNNEEGLLLAEIARLVRADCKLPVGAQMLGSLGAGVYDVEGGTTWAVAKNKLEQMGVAWCRPGSDGPGPLLRAVLAVLEARGPGQCGEAPALEPPAKRQCLRPTAAQAPKQWLPFGFLDCLDEFRPCVVKAGGVVKPLD